MNGVAKKGFDKEMPPEINEILNQEKKSGITNHVGMALFDKRLKLEIQRLKEEIRKINYKSKLIGFGASRTAALIIDLLGLRNKIEYIIDDDPRKVGKYLPLGNIPIISFDDHKAIPDDVNYLILGWAQTERIINKLKAMDKNFSAITIYPQLEIINFCRI